MWQEFKRNWTESWRFIGETFRLMGNRYWLIWMLNFMLGFQLAFWLNRVFDFKFSLFAVLVGIYFALSPLSLLLWLPQYLNQRKPHLYRGVIRSIGKWIGYPYPTLK